MTTIRKFVYAVLLAVTAMNFAPSLAAAQEPAHGKFTLKHNVNWGNAVVPAGDYEFYYDPYESKPVLTLSKVSGARTGFMLLVVTTENSRPSDSNRLLLETTYDASYVRAMELAKCGMTLHFSVPSHALKQMAKAVPQIAPSGQ